MQNFQTLRKFHNFTRMQPFRILNSPHDCYPDDQTNPRFNIHKLYSKRNKLEYPSPSKTKGKKPPRQKPYKFITWEYKKTQIEPPETNWQIKNPVAWVTALRPLPKIPKKKSKKIINKDFDSYQEGRTEEVKGARLDLSYSS